MLFDFAPVRDIYFAIDVGMYQLADLFRELIHPYVDGEINVANGREIEQHLGGCDDCRRLEQRWARCARRCKPAFLLRAEPHF